MRCCASELWHSAAAARAGVSPTSCVSSFGGSWPPDLADALGLTPIYVNRILQAFRREQLITLQQHQLTLLDVEKLQTISGVTPDYLQLGTISPDIIDYFDPLGRSLGGSISHPTPKSAVLTRFAPITH